MIEILKTELVLDELREKFTVMKPNSRKGKFH
jgi:hypothetical protein